MASSLYTALSGLQANQTWIDVIGNNLANSNTAGFKGSQAVFSDQFARTLSYASGPNGGRGGRNPAQVGQGVRVAGTSRSFSQGGITNTGRVFDVALQGNGFFAVRNGAQNFYTRAGTFGLDAANNLIDQRTGSFVLDPSGSPIQLDTTSMLAPQATSSAEIAGNLPKVVTGPLPEVLSSADALAQGFAASLTSSGSGPFTIPAGETWTMRVTVDGSAPQTVSVTSVTGSVTAAEVATAIDALDGVSASVNGSGQVMITSDGVGEDATLKVTSGTTGRDLASLIGISTSLVTGSETAANGTTSLNDLPGNTSDYVDGDSIAISGVDADGTPINATFTYGAASDGTTIADLVAFIDAQFAGATVEMNSAGQLVVTADTAGEAQLQLSISDEAGTVGATDWTRYAMTVTTEGTGSDVVTTSMEVFDPSGVAHTMTLSFERQADGSWSILPSVDDSEGSVVSAPITGIFFNDNGSPTGLGGVNPEVTVYFNGQSSPQTLTLALGADGEFSGLTQFGGDGEVLVQEQNGYGAGELASMSVDGDGSIIGLYTNGQSQTLGAIGIATFSNPEGLTQYGDNLFTQSTNSGNAVLSSGNLGAAGSVVGGALENSNIDTAEQFVNLIEAQRGFQANSRVITVQNEVMRDMVNIV